MKSNFKITKDDQVTHHLQHIILIGRRLVRLLLRPIHPNVQRTPLVGTGVISNRLKSPPFHHVGIMICVRACVKTTNVGIFLAESGVAEWEVENREES